MGIAEISKRTRIREKYLENLEESEYSKLPADVYVKGFLRSYAAFMGLDAKSLVRQYEREKGIQKSIKKIVDVVEERKPINFSSVVITPKMIAMVLIVILSITSFAYLYIEVNDFISQPRLVIMKPNDGSNVDGNSVHVSGVAEKDALVFINDQPVMVNENGEFSEDVGLKSGINVINVKARNKFDKETSQSVSINANLGELLPSEVGDLPGEDGKKEQENEGRIYAEIFVNPNQTWLSIEADGNIVYSGTLLPQSVQTFEAENILSITSGKGNGTFVKINGKDLGVISDDPGVVRNVQYDANGKMEKSTEDAKQETADDEREKEEN